MTRSKPLNSPLRAALAAVLFCFASSAPAADESAPSVVASIQPVHSLVSAVMDGVGEPRLLMRGTVSPHTFNLRPSDSALLQNARVVFLVDDTIENTLFKAVGALARDARVITLSEADGIVHRSLREGGAFEAHDHDHGHGHECHDDGDHDHGHGHERHDDDDHDHHEEGEHGAFDMHIWLDPVNAGAMAREVAEVLSEVDPANAETYVANAAAFQGRVDGLIQEIARQTAPIRAKPFIIFHDAYRHFEDRFGLTAVGSVVVSVDQSPSVRRVMELREKIRGLGATCVFAEVQFESRLVDTIIEGTGARAGLLDPLGSTIESGPDAYFGMIREMAAEFKDCLMSEG